MGDESDDYSHEDNYDWFILNQNGWTESILFDYCPHCGCDEFYIDVDRVIHCLLCWKSVATVCQDCNGSGLFSDDGCNYFTCDTCEGEGEIKI